MRWYLVFLIVTTNVCADVEDPSESQFDISGVIEVSYQNDMAEGETLVDTVEFNITKHLTENLNANLIFKSEADDSGELPTSQLVDEATLNGDIKGIDFTVDRFDNTTIIVEYIKVDADTTTQEDAKLTQV